MREKVIEDYLVKKVRALGGEVRKLRWIGRNGAPDRVVMLPGLLLWIELKQPGEKPSPAQAREFERMRNMGQVVTVIDSLELVDEFFSEVA